MPIVHRVLMVCNINKGRSQDPMVEHKCQKVQASHGQSLSVLNRTGPPAGKRVSRKQEHSRLAGQW